MEYVSYFASQVLTTLIEHHIQYDHKYPHTHQHTYTRIRKPFSITQMKMPNLVVIDGHVEDG